MKLTFKILFFTITSAMTVMLGGCDDSDGDEPVISYIRVTDPAASDSLLVAASQGQLIAIIGQNLQGVQQIWLNDRQASLSPTLITSTSILVRIPTQIPSEVNNKLRLIFGGGKVLEHDFALAINGPVVTAMELEFVDAGDVATIRGDYFYAPLTVTFTGGVTGEVKSVEDQAIKVEVPEGAEPGPITVVTNFGKATSTFYFRDGRAFLNYDDLNASGSWRPGTVSSADGLDGNYLVLKGVLEKNQRTEDYSGGGFVSEFWAQVNGRPEGNLLPGAPKDYVIKFEARVVEWYGSYLNICFSNWNHNNNNQEYWSNDYNARAIWGPWKEKNATYSTDGWITVSIPMTEFKYAIAEDAGDVVYTSKTFDPNVTGSMTFWVVGSPLASASPVELHIDNVRIVPK